MKAILRTLESQIDHLESSDDFAELRSSVWRWRRGKSGQSISRWRETRPLSGEERDLLKLELVIADLDPLFISSCAKYFGPMIKSGSVRLCHGPMQEAVIESLQSNEGVQTYLVFGSYGVFPDPRTKDESRALISGVSKAVAHAFPSTWQRFATLSKRELAMVGSDMHDDMPWMKLMGHVWMANPTIDIGSAGSLTLVACAAYPRDQRPTEMAAAARRFERALKMIWASASERAKRLGGVTKVRIITHAMGSFVGHADVGVFAKGMAHAFDHFLSEN